MRTARARERRLERAHQRGHRHGRRGGRGRGDRQRAPGGAVGAGGPWPVVAISGAAPKRQGARLRLDRRPGPRATRSRTTPGPRSGTRHRYADSCGPDHRLQHLLQRTRPPDGRVDLHRRREQEPAPRRDRADPHIQSQHERLEPWAEHARGALVPERHAAQQRRDPDHRGRSRHARGPEDRRRVARAKHRVPQPAALPLARRRPRRPRLLLRSGSNYAEPQHRRRRRLAELHPARLRQPFLRQPRPLRHRQGPRRRRRLLAEERPRHRPQRRDAAGDARARWRRAAASTT